MDLHTWLLYGAAALALALSPGPNGLLALTHGALYGYRMAAFTVAGGVTGFVLVIALSMFGIGALLQASLVWLTVLKIAGGLYLVFLGVQLWRAPPIAAAMTAGPGAVSGKRLARQGFLSATTNPKAILFFAAFLPQFIDPHRGLLVQFAVMAGTFAVIEIGYELGVAMAAHRIKRWLARAGHRFNQVCGGVFAALGVGLALRD